MVAVATEHTEILQTFRDRLPNRPYCMEAKDDYQKIRGFDLAIQEPYIQHNTPAIKHALVFDLDLGKDFDKTGCPRPGSTYAWERADLPPPNFLCRNPANGNCHYYYVLATPIARGSNARSHPQDYAKAIERAYQRQLSADIGYVGHISKNPFHDKWSTIVFRDEPYELAELADYVELIRSSHHEHQDDAVGYGRNTTLFNNLRQWAYSEVEQARGAISEDRWHKDVLRQAQQYNSMFNSPLSFNETKATAKSVAKWTWNFYTGDKKASPLNLDPTTPLEEKQRIAAAYTAKKKVDERTAEVIAAIGILKAQGKRISKAAVSRVVGLSRQHISQKYGHCFESIEHNKTVNLATTSDNSALRAKHRLYGPKGQPSCLSKDKRGARNARHPLSAAIAATPRTLNQALGMTLSLGADDLDLDSSLELVAKYGSQRLVRELLKGIKKFRLYGLVDVVDALLILKPVDLQDESFLKVLGFESYNGVWSLKVPPSMEQLVLQVAKLMRAAEQRRLTEVDNVFNYVSSNRLIHVNLNLDGYRRGLECESKQSLQGKWGTSMTVRLDHNLYEYAVKFPFDEDLVYSMSRLSDRRYDRNNKVWYVPVWLYHDLQSLLQERNV